MSHVHLPSFTIESVFVSLSETLDWGLTAYGIPEHWARTKGAGIKVAVLDTGIDETHPDLRDAIDEARDFSGSRFGPADRNGHGTHVAGTIGARQNEIGVVGVAPACRLLIGKVLDDSGAGNGAAVAAGIDWACDSGADIISLSLGAPRPDGTIREALLRATDKGKFIIAAAGNSGPRAGVDYPARWKETVAVAAVDRHGRVARFSSQGPEVDIAAPGEDVLSTFKDGAYAKLSGTSMATPFVTGVVALVLSVHRQTQKPSTPLETVEQLCEHLKRTATDAGPAGHDPAFGWGLINAGSMIADASRTGGSPQLPIDENWPAIIAEWLEKLRNHVHVPAQPGDKVGINW